MIYNAKRYNPQYKFRDDAERKDRKLNGKKLGIK